MLFPAGVLLAQGYIFFMLIAWSSNPRKKHYNRLFRSNTFLIHLSISFLVACFGYYRMTTVDARDACLFMPLIFLILFRFFDSIVLMVEGRHILVVSRGDSKPPEYIWWLDGTFSILSALFPMPLSVILGNMLT